MQIGETKYSVGSKSWKDRTPLMLKFVCDFLMLVSLAIAVLWPDGVLALKLSVLLKLLSNFVSEHIPVSVQQEIKDGPIEQSKPE